MVKDRAAGATAMLWDSRWRLPNARGLRNLVFAGFIEPEGEVSRIVVFPGEVAGEFGEESSKTDASFLKRILPDILFDFHQINDTPGIR